MQSTVLLIPATPADYPLLVRIGHEAFHADKLAYGRGPDLYENPAFLLPLLERGDDRVRKIVVGQETVGLMITSEKTPTARWLGCVCLLPAHQGMGYGMRAMQLIEQAYPHVCQWGLDTPAGSVRNRRFYERAGYRVVGESEPWPGFTLLAFEKRL